MNSFELSQIKDQEDVILIDVRTKEEISSGYIKGHKSIFTEIMKGKNREININFNQELNKELIKFNISSDIKLIFICAAGKRSEIALNSFKNETNLECINYIDGVNGWLKMGFNLSKVL